MGSSVRSTPVRPSGPGEKRPTTGGPRSVPSIGLGSASDHAAVFHLLRAVFQAPSPEQFRSMLDRPGYEPSDWLLLRRRERLIGQLLLAHRAMWFGAACVPIGVVGWLGVAPPFRRQGCARRLLRAAEKHLAEQGAVLGLLRTRQPGLFRRLGWTPCRPMPRSEAPTRVLLPELTARRRVGRSKRRQLNIRPVRRWEVGGLARVYSENLGGSYGLPERTEAYWHWLIRRQAHDQLIVASDGPEGFDAQRHSTAVLAYAVLHRRRIIEMIAAPGAHDVAYELLARVCEDAIEHDVHNVVAHAPTGHPVHKLFAAVGGSCSSGAAGEPVPMVKVLRVGALLESIEPELRARARRADLALPVQLGLTIDGDRCQLRLDERRLHIDKHRTGRNYVALDHHGLARGLMGQPRWNAQEKDQDMRPSTAVADRLARLLFPEAPFWSSTWDELPATG